MTAGSAGFAKFLADNAIGDPAAAEALGTNEISVYQWRTGRARPKEPFRRAIATWTSEAVPESAWLTDEEQATAAKVVPFEPAANGAQ